MSIVNSSSLIPGLTYILDFLSLETEKEIIQIIKQNPWISLQKRRVQNYGYVFDYIKGITDFSQPLGPFPNVLEQLAAKLQAQGFFSQTPDQIIVNEYMPGQGIPFHVDSPSSCGETVSSVSLISGVQMDFRQVDTQEIRSLYLAPRSLLILQKEARYQWQHGIMPRFSDQIDGQEQIREYRISLNFRIVNQQIKNKEVAKK